VLVAERRKAGRVGVIDRVALGAQLRDGGIDPESRTAGRRPVIVVKSVANPACPVTRLGPFFLQSGV
jgi:hypothetical protein